ncbi:MAG: hypothetical protein K0R09_402 [Clostridiales bacterium]|jgi:hypothetical protein|nr:hypothetical protein [Clostridiales bacterium]
MFKDGKKVLKYAAKLCIFAVVALIALKILGKGSDNSIIPILALCVVANGISYLLYKPK